VFYSHKIGGNGVPIVDEWRCGYVKGIALDAEAWQPLIEARPDWFEVIQGAHRLCCSKGGIARLDAIMLQPLLQLVLATPGCQ
jgi:hypothetical protein